MLRNVADHPLAVIVELVQAQPAIGNGEEQPECQYGAGGAITGLGPQSPRQTVGSQEDGDEEKAELQKLRAEWARTSVDQSNRPDSRISAVAGPRMHPMT